MDQTGIILARANEIYARTNSTTTSSSTSKERPPVYKAIGISLAIASGVFIGTSFVLKKTGLLKANVKYNEEAGEGYGYLKNAYWWTGMTLMIIGEICNFVAYAFVDAILVTPLGALSVVITTILSAIFLKERLSFVGKVGCFMCIIGSVVIVMNAPAQSSAGTIQEMKHFVLAPAFLSYAGVIIVGCLFIALWVGPRYGKKSMLVYLSICSLIGGLSVVATQGLGAAIVTQAGGTPQFNQWFLYLLLVFVVATLVTEIIFLNKALNLFNAALVTPTYYVFFTSSTIVTSAILFQGFKGTPTSIITVVMGFLQICSGVILLQLSKSAKDVPDATVFKGDLDQVRTVAEQEEPESEPKADAIRGTAAILRRFSQSRQQKEVAEAKRIHEDKIKDQMEPIGEDEQVEWDGLRRRKTLVSGPHGSLRRQKTVHPPLGMARFPDDEEDHEPRPPSSDIIGSGGGAFNGGFMDSFRRGASSRFKARNGKCLSTGTPGSTEPPMSLNASGEHGTPQASGSLEMEHVYGLPPNLVGTDGTRDIDTEYHGKYSGKHIVLAEEVKPVPSRGSSLAPSPPPHAKRQFSFSNVFHRNSKHDAPTPSSSSGISHEQQHRRPLSRLGLGSRQSSKEHSFPGLKTATEEERLGLVKGDSASTNMLALQPEYSGNSGDDDDDDDEEDDEWSPRLDRGKPGISGNIPGHAPLIREEEKESDDEGPDVPAKNTPRKLGQNSGGEGGRYKEWEGFEDADARGGGGGGGSKGSGRPAFI